MPPSSYNVFFESLDCATGKFWGGGDGIFWEAYGLFAFVCKSFQTVAFTESVLTIQVYLFL